MHGGGAPQVKRKAAERLGEAAASALAAWLLVVREALADASVAIACRAEILRGVIELTKLAETAAGRVSERREIITAGAVDAEIARLTAEMGRGGHVVTVTRNVPPECAAPFRSARPSGLATSVFA